ncbi:MAG: serine hydrolase [bacterium]|nr:serine hydrolase [bacterium]
MRPIFRGESRTVSRQKILGIGLFLVIVFAISPRSDDKTLFVSSAIQESSETGLDKRLGSSTDYIALKSGARKPLIYANQYLLLDTNTAEVIIGQGEDSSIPIASTTKMTTALVAITKLSLNEVATISNKPPTIQGSKIGLLTGEKITVRSLIQGLLIYSGNDAAFALAETFAKEPGDYSKFVSEMNDFVASNHLTNTTYGDPAGLDDETGRSTPRDLANVARLLLREPFLAETVATQNLTIWSVDGQISHQLKNTNRLIDVSSSYYLPNTLGIKTGFTLDAGHSMVAAYKWRDRVLIGVVMNTIESTNTASAQEMNKLFRWADSALELRNY